MFDSIGWGEIVVLVLAALFIFGPERLPDVAKDAARGLARAREATTGIRRQLTDAAGEDFPQLPDVDPHRYHPKALIRQHLMGDDGPAAPDDAAGTVGSRARVRPDADDG